MPQNLLPNDQEKAIGSSFEAGEYTETFLH
jgi:hypothetical protein